MAAEQWNVGSISITKVEEVEGGSLPIEFLPQIMRAATLEEIKAIEWLRPTYLVNNKMSTLTHSLLIETPTHRIAVDTGIGNGKKRLSEALGDLDTDFLQRFEQVWRRDEVDGILLTHLHVDHVGWNTIFQDGRWQPTFPTSRYYAVREEYEHWAAFVQDPDAPKAYTEFGWSLVDAVATVEDSVKPIVDAGLVTWVEPGQEVVPGISLMSTPGHTPGHVSVVIEDAGETAVITGDLFHSQVQVARPDWSVEMDTDLHAAARTRKAFLERFADSPTLVLGTHFGTPTGFHIARDGDSYRMVPQPG
jgi:glyoxylase-like metal-dependent hydrolase (beta-lactamase superfamily II)